MPISKEHKELLASQSASKTLPEWLEYFDNQYSKSQIYSYCYHNNFIIKKLSKEEKSKIQSQNGKKYHINENYFKNWNSNMAYILGLWYADGCIYRDKIFDITLHKKDKYILKKVAEELQYEGPLYDYVDKQVCRINFSCVTIYNDIISLGGKECKSLDITFPFVPKQFLPDFIRGYFDGDGGVYCIKNKRLNTSFCSGSKKFLDQLLLILQKEASIQGGSYDASSKSLRFGKRDSIKLRDYIYNNSSFYLKRKKDKLYNY